jgi:hypothetical protein
MRFIVLVLSCSALILLACQRKTSPATSQSALPAEAPVAAPAPVKTDTPVVSKPATAAVPITPVTGSLMEMQAGQMIYTTRCAKCHEAKPVDNWTQTEWQPILKSMVRKSKLDSLEDHHVRLYVNTHAKKD